MDTRQKLNKEFFSQEFDGNHTRNPRSSHKKSLQYQMQVCREVSTAEKRRQKKSGKRCSSEQYPYGLIAPQGLLLGYVIESEKKC